MKAELRKTEFRKTVLFMIFTALVIYMLHLDSKAGHRGATVSAAVEALER